MGPLLSAKGDVPDAEEFLTAGPGDRGLDGCPDRSAGPGQGPTRPGPARGPPQELRSQGGLLSGPPRRSVPRGGHDLSPHPPRVFADGLFREFRAQRGRAGFRGYAEEGQRLHRRIHRLFQPPGRRPEAGHPERGLPLSPRLFGPGAPGRQRPNDRGEGRSRRRRDRLLEPSVPARFRSHRHLRRQGRGRRAQLLDPAIAGCSPSTAAGGERPGSSSFSMTRPGRRSSTRRGPSILPRRQYASP
ncbi:MAG: hypothetical protein MZV64_11520 [Ignavibacteriales bacterium]|nr:hypothetical protein [Ignavibacteriales bacterium]MCK7518298.1 hypothetical protein [Ignavibacteriales bacterium]